MNLPATSGGIGGGWIAPRFGTGTAFFILFALLQGVDFESVEDTTFWSTLVVVTLFSVVLLVVVLDDDDSEDVVVLAECSIDWKEKK
jgi:hypothetical protein